MRSPTELRRWFDHDPARFTEFRARYRRELAAQSERLGELRRRAASSPLTILYIGHARARAAPSELNGLTPASRRPGLSGSTELITSVSLTSGDKTGAGG